MVIMLAMATASFATFMAVRGVDLTVVLAGGLVASIVVAWLGARTRRVGLARGSLALVAVAALAGIGAGLCFAAYWTAPGDVPTVRGMLAGGIVLSGMIFGVLGITAAAGRAILEETGS